MVLNELCECRVSWDVCEPNVNEFGDVQRAVEIPERWTSDLSGREPPHHGEFLGMSLPTSGHWGRKDDTTRVYRLPSPFETVLTSNFFEEGWSQAFRTPLLVNAQEVDLAHVKQP